MTSLRSHAGSACRPLFKYFCDAGSGKASMILVGDDDALTCSVAHVPSKDDSAVLS